MTIAMDIILDDVDESIRFSLECRARVFHQMENFCYVEERIPVIEKYYLNLRVSSLLMKTKKTHLKCMFIFLGHKRQIQYYEF
jgi:hypothetical protein